MSDSSQQIVIVRDWDGMRQLEAVDSWTSMTMLGALSADPRSFDEFARAWLRYRPGDPLEDMPWTEVEGAPAADQWLLLDLACLRIVASLADELPESPAAFQRDEGDWDPSIPVVWINFPPDWQCLEGVPWQTALTALPVPNEPLDARGVLFGRALAEGVAWRTLDIARREALPDRIDWPDLDWEETPSAEQRENVEQWHTLTIRVHADWLTTPRADLEGDAPRAFLHRGRNWVDRELQNREMQWSNERGAPQSIGRDTFAYRCGPLGRHEVVMYFDLCREVIATAWDQIAGRPEIDETALTNLLHEHAQRWLAEGSIDDDPTPPAVIIENERRRMPLVGDGSHLDCDCPICRIEAEGGFGPMFRGYDGHHLELDDEFAFSLCATREEWEKEQEDFRRLSAEMDEKQRQREAAGEDEFSSVWTSSFVDDEAISRAGASPRLTILALAMRVTELVTDLKSADADRELVDTLNNAFDDFRAADDDDLLSAAATAQFVDALEQIAAAQPELTAKVADLQSQLDERRRQNDLPF